MENDADSKGQTWVACGSHDVGQKLNAECVEITRSIWCLDGRIIEWRCQAEGIKTGRNEGVEDGESETGRRDVGKSEVGEGSEREVVDKSWMLNSLTVLLVNSVDNGRSSWRQRDDEAPRKSD